MYQVVFLTMVGPHTPPSQVLPGNNNVILRKVAVRGDTTSTSILILVNTFRIKTRISKIRTIIAIIEDLL